LNAPREVSRKWRFYYDIGYNNGSLTILCHVVYATLGFIVPFRVSFTISSFIKKYLPTLHTLESEDAMRLGCCYFVDGF